MSPNVPTRNPERSSQRLDRDGTGLGDGTGLTVADENRARYAVAPTRGFASSVGISFALARLVNMRVRQVAKICQISTLPTTVTNAIP